MLDALPVVQKDGEDVEEIKKNDMCHPAANSDTQNAHRRKNSG